MEKPVTLRQAYFKTFDLLRGEREWRRCSDEPGPFVDSLALRNAAERSGRSDGCRGIA